MTLFDLGDYASIRSASASLASSEASLRRASADLRSSLRRSFSALLLAQSGLEVARRVLTLRRNNAELVNLRYESGRESKGNMLRAKAQLLQAEVALATAGRELRTSQRELGRQLGREGFEAYVATGTFTAAPPPARPDDFGALLPLRPEIASAEASLRSSEAALASARADYFPNLSANYSRTRTGGTEFPSSRYGWSAGASLSLPLFGGGPAQTMLASLSAKRGREAARAGPVRRAPVRPLSELGDAWRPWRTPTRRSAVPRTLLAAARQRTRAGRRALRLGPAQLRQLGAHRVGPRLRRAAGGVGPPHGDGRRDGVGPGLGPGIGRMR